MEFQAAVYFIIRQVDMLLWRSLGNKRLATVPKITLNNGQKVKNALNWQKSLQKHLLCRLIL